MSDEILELEHLQAVAHQLTEGKFAARVTIPSLAGRNDAIASLARSLNNLAETLGANLSHLERRLRQLWKLNRVERELALILNVRELLQRLPEAAAEILGAEAACLILREQPDLESVAVQWPSGGAESLRGWLRQKTEEVAQDGLPRRFREGQRGMGVPLEVRPPAGEATGELQVIGALSVAHGDPSRSFDVDEQMILFTLAGSAGLAIERSRILAESEQSRLRALMESMKEGVLLVEVPSGKIRLANAAAGHLLGRLRESGLLSPDKIGEAKLLALATSVAAEPSRAAEDELFIDGRVVLARATLAQSLIGETMGYLITLADVTLERRMERLREDLSAMIVHDLRTPLTVIIGALETLAQTAGEQDAAFQQEMVDMGLSGARSLLGLVNSLLDISRLESGEMPLDKAALSVEELIRAALCQVERLARQNNIEIRLELDPLLAAVWADKEKIERVLVNLLGNALKFTPQGGSITLSACDDSPHGWVLISVTDTGEGIPPEYLERVFGKFEQVADRKAGRKMSTGLGLTFCKLAIEAHGGKIWVESPAFSPGADDGHRGSRFTFTLPTRK